MENRKNSRENMMSIVAGRANFYIQCKEIKGLIPFTGDLPILKPFEREEYYKTVYSTMLVSDVKNERHLEIMQKGNFVYILTKSFEEYLDAVGLSEEEYLNLPADKSEFIFNLWMDKAHIDPVWFDLDRK